jgi:HK97 family phage major capsid protein
MSDELNELNQITHQYRKSLDAFERRTGLAPQMVDTRGAGEEREKFARMDADLTAIELMAQNKALEARLAKLEAEPTLDSRAARPRTSGNPSDPSSPEFAARWLKALAKGDAIEFRDLSLGSSNAAIPTDLERRIVEKKQMVGVIRGLATVTRINSNRNLAIENALPTSAWVAEAGGQTATDPTFSTQVQIRPRALRCSTILSQQFIEDAIGTGDIGSGMDYVARKMAISMALKEEEAFTIGNPGAGVPEPDGLCRNGGTVAQGIDLGSGAALTTTTFDQVIDAAHTVAPEYRSGAQVSWLISDAFLRHIRKLRSGSSPSDYLWLPAGAPNTNALTSGVPGTIYGFPYRVGKYVPIATADNNVFAIFGNFEYYEIFDRVGVTALMDPYSLQANLQTRLNVYQRLDAKITLPEAFAYIRG